jgi:hypothetical protein
MTGGIVMALNDGMDHDADARADEHVVLTFTNRGERALDQFAAVITNGMARTPRDIADVLAQIYHAPLDELVSAFDAIVVEIEEHEASLMFVCGPCRDGRHSACDDRERQPDYRGCCCQHKESEPASDNKGPRDKSRRTSAPAVRR